MKRHCIPQLDVQLQENPWQESSDCLVDDFFGTSGNEMEQRVLTRHRKDFQIGSEDWNDVAFTGQRIRWTQDSQNGPYIEVSQDKAIDELEEVPVNEIRRNTSIALLLVHTLHRSLLGQINWLQSRHSSNAATKCPDVLRWQLLQQLTM